jgi:hypothetical protein
VEPLRAQAALGKDRGGGLRDRAAIERHDTAMHGYRQYGHADRLDLLPLIIVRFRG